MRGVQVRGAGGLLVGVCIQPLLRVFDIGAYDDGVFDAFRNFFWFPSGATPPGDTVPFLLLRAALVFGGLVLGVLGVAGLRAVRFPIVVVSVLLVVGILPWAIWLFDARTYQDPPPDWVLEHPLWWTSSREMALTFLGMLVATIVLALRDRPAQPAVAGPPGYGPAPYALAGAPPAGPTGPWAAPGPAAPAPAPGSGPWPVPGRAAPQDAPPPPAPPGEGGSRQPPTPF
jgi:hypothetical protein